MMETPCYRVRTVRNYTKETKLTVILAIEAGDPRLADDRDGSIARLRRWVRVQRFGGTNAEVFDNFHGEICTVIEGMQHIPMLDKQHVILWGKQLLFCIR